jgi:5-methylcytosine-specific restriction endonuclease McrBC regulatory subunit McrC
MSMDAFFEAWVETVLRSAVTQTGGTLKTGRQRETVAPLAWEPPFRGAQKSLVPDFVLDLDECTLIVDAKYKRHFEELEHGRWASQDTDLRERHRRDLLQILSYANLSETSRVICCLVYPCSIETWESLRLRGRLFHKAALAARSRQVQTWLTAVPMCTSPEQVACALAAEIRKAVWAT